MGLSSDLLSQFAKATTDNTKDKKETSTVYGTVVDAGTTTYVQLDGSSTTTPVSTTVNVKKGDRVIVMIKNHTATVTGNLGDPSINQQTLDDNNKDVNSRITELGIAIADRVTTEQLNAIKATITDEMVAKDVVVQDTLQASIVAVDERLTAADAEISGKLTAAEAQLLTLNANKLSAEDARLTYATIANLTATNTQINNLQATHASFENATASKFTATDAAIADLNTKKLDAESAKVIYANIDFSNIGEAAIRKFFSESGIIENLVVGDGTVTGKLVGVTISGDLIEGNTVKAEKLVVKGSDGLYYKLNIEAGATTSTEVSATDLQNGLHGTAIIAKTITAEKISVSDLVAFGATIGGFHISEESLYSDVKSSVNNTTRGIYLDKTGQVNIGDSSNFIKYYKDQNGNYKLAISAESIVFSTSNKSVQTVINEAVETVDTKIDELEIGGLNLIKNSNFANGIDKWTPVGVTYNIGTDDKHGSYIKIASTAAGGSEHRLYPETVTNFTHSKGTYTLSFYAKTDAACSLQTNVAGGTTGVKNYQLTTAWTKFVHTYECAGSGSITFWLNTANTNAYITKIKLEHGDKPTDWSLAPEDMATSEDVKKAQSTADEAETISNEAKALIAQLSESISMLVTDANGTSLMTQTESGWTFSTAEIQTIVNATSEGLNDLTKELDDTNSAVGILQQAVSDLGAIAEYVNIGVYEDEPCIELGEGDSDFKLRITNTRMMFTEGNTILAYFNNQSFHVRKAVVEEELQQGGFVWKVRSNGNLGLVWKGGNN